MIDRAIHPSGLLGRHVGQGARQLTGGSRAGHGHDVGGQPEIDQRQAAPVGAHHHVAGVDVAVDHPLLVQGRRRSRPAGSPGRGTGPWATPAGAAAHRGCGGPASSRTSVGSDPGRPPAPAAGGPAGRRCRVEHPKHRVFVPQARGGVAGRRARTHRLADARSAAAVVHPQHHVATAAVDLPRRRRARSGRLGDRARGGDQGDQGGGAGGEGQLQAGALRHRQALGVMGGKVPSAVTVLPARVMPVLASRAGPVRRMKSAFWNLPPRSTVTWRALALGRPDRPG